LPAWLDSTVASMTRYLHHTTVKLPRQHRYQHDSVSTSRHDQVASAAPSPAWLSSTVASMSQYLYHTTVKSPRQRHRQHNLAVTSRHCQHWLGSAITSMTQGLNAYFPDQLFDSKVHYRSGSKAWGVSLQPTTRLGYTATDASPILNRGERIITNKIMGYFVELAKSYW
jgi:hypothetical protein